MLSAGCSSISPGSHAWGAWLPCVGIGLQFADLAGVHVEAQEVAGVALPVLVLALQPGGYVGVDLERDRGHGRGGCGVLEIS
jgi:hypothetical protein